MNKNPQAQFQPLNIFYVIFTVFMCIFSLILYLYGDATIIQSEKTNELIIDTSNTMSEISLNFQMVMDTYAMHFVDEDLNEALQNLDTYDSPGYVENAQYVLKAIYYMIYGNHLITDVGFVRTNGQLLASTTLSDVDRSMVKQEIKRYPQKTPYQISDVYDNKSIIYGRKRVLLTREIYKMEDKTSVGHMVYFIDFNALLEVMKQVKSTSDAHLGMLVVNDKQVIYNQKENEASKQIAQHILNSKASQAELKEQIYTAGGQEYVLHMEQDPLSGWVFASYYRKHAFIQESVEKNKWFILFMSVFCLTIVFIEIKSFRFLNNTIFHLNQAMKTMETGKFVQLDKKFEKNRELAGVVTGFNRMSKSLNQMIQENYIEQLKRKEAEIKMLHFQINPHFLYNTLNLISSLAVLDEKKKIMLITNSMSELFRYNMQGEYKVRVENELHVIKQYISIQELRFPKKFHVFYEIDSNLLQCEIGKFTLQPIVENIFKHNSLKDKLEIRIIVKREDENTFTISVWDSGAGIEPNQLESLNKQLQGTSSESDVTIGIFNVNSRIKRRAGDGYGMRISSEWGAWTEVVMTLPI